ncbi:MAG: response regulator transcription factor [Chthoniobacteraceae bacterium]
MNPLSHPIKVVLVEDHRMFREWLGHMISAANDFTVVGETDNIADALTMLEKLRPDIAIVDLTLRGSSGLELIKNLKAQDLAIPVLVLSMHEDELYAERVLRAGAKGYISKNEASSTVATAIRRVLSGEIYLNEKITSKMLSSMTRRSPHPASGMELLADRELEVFQLIGKGFNMPKIAEQLRLGETTVGTYRARIKEKLQIKTSAELYAHAARWIQEHGG